MLARRWIDAHNAASFLSAARLGELQFGTSWLMRRGASRKAGALGTSIEEVALRFQDRLLAIDAGVARHAGEFLARAEAASHHPGLADAFIAATADTRGFQVVSYNARHFAALGVAFRAPGEDVAP